MKRSASGVPLGTAPESGMPAGESDFSPRKIAIATACLLGSTFVPYVHATISPLMMLPMTKEFGWGRTDYALASAFFFLFGAVTVLIFGRVADRVGVRPVLLTGAIFGGIVMVLLSFQTASLWRLYATYALLGGFGSSGVGYAKVIGALFTRHRGKALAIFGAESTVALAVLPILTNTFITHFGWRGAYVGFGLISFLVVPLIYFVIQEPGVAVSPSGGAIGPAVLGEPASRRPARLEGMTASEIRRDRTFWLIVLLAMLSGGLNQGLITHVVAAITDKGFSATVAAEVLSISTLLGISGTLAGGFAVDFFRTAKPMALFALLGALGALLFAFVNGSFGGVPLLLVAMGILGAASAANRPIATYLQTRFFGLRAFAEANAIQIVFQGVAMAITPPLFGMIYDREGSYGPVYWILVAGGVLGSLIYLALGPYRYAADIGADPDRHSPASAGGASGPGPAGAVTVTSMPS